MPVKTITSAPKKLFVQEVKTHGDVRTAFAYAYPNCKAEQAEDRLRALLLDASIAEALKDTSCTSLSEPATQEPVNFTFAEKRALLRRVALGIEKITKRVKVDGEWQWEEQPISMADRLRALEMDNRMAGEEGDAENNTPKTTARGIVNITPDGSYVEYPQQ